MRILRIASVVPLLNVLIASSVLLFGQEAQTHSNANEELALQEAAKIYDTHLRRNSMIYTGRSYYEGRSGTIGHPFFEDNYWENGSIVYDNSSYDSIYLKYDIYKDLILIENFNSSGYSSPITLYSKKVSSFDLMGYHFIRLEEDTLSNIKAGFYNQMYRNNGLESPGGYSYQEG